MKLRLMHTSSNYEGGQVNVPEIKPIELTPEEAALRQQMEAELSSGSPYSGKAARSLLKSLQNRAAIPQARVHDFTEPFPGGRGKSHKDVFEKNGCRGDAIAEHPHFVSYLRYFMNGPALPANTIEGFRKIMIEDSGTSNMVMDQLRKFVRAETRRLKLERDVAREEFWRLAQEVGYVHAATIREAAASAA
jgi:hypothetical protein